MSIISHTPRCASTYLFTKCTLRRRRRTRHVHLLEVSVWLSQANLGEETGQVSETSEPNTSDVFGVAQVPTSGPTLETEKYLALQNANL